MNLIIGTSYFDSRIEAYDYYEKQGDDKQTVKQYIKEGLIHIGIPPNIDEFDLSINEGRYFIKEK